MIKTISEKAHRLLRAAKRRSSRSRGADANELRRFESFGIDAQYFKPYRGWELSDEECLELKKALEERAAYADRRRQDVGTLISRKYDLSADDVTRKYSLALEEGYKEYWFLADGIFMLTDEEIKAHKNLRASEAEDDLEKERKKKYGDIRKQIIETRQWSRGKYSLEQLKALNSCGCAADEFIIFRIWDRSSEDARRFLTAEVKHRAWLNNASSFEDSMTLRNKICFGEAFREFANRIIFPSRGMSFEDFEAAVKGLDYIVYKPEEGDKGIGIQRLRINESKDQNKEVYDRICSLEPGVVEEYLYQHPDIASFYPDAVNTIRAITAIKDGKASVVMAALRTGRYGSTDNWSQGGVSAGINVESGIIETDGADYCGTRYEAHPATGKVFYGAMIPEWDRIVEFCCEAAGKCPDIPMIGWDVAVLSDGRVVLIEGNQSFGTKSIQTPYSLADIGLRERFEKYL